MSKKESPNNPLYVSPVTHGDNPLAEVSSESNLKAVGVSDWTDTALIECDLCKLPLNGKSLWVVGEGDKTMTLCESCYADRYQGEDDDVI